MTAFIIRRLMQSVLVVVVMSVIVFCGVHLVGDPVYLLINPQADQKDIEAAIKRSASTGRSGSSTCTSSAVRCAAISAAPSSSASRRSRSSSSACRPRWSLRSPPSLMAIVLGIPLGLYAGLYPDTPVSRAIMATSILGFSLPTFWVGPDAHHGVRRDAGLAAVDRARTDGDVSRHHHRACSRSTA